MTTHERYSLELIDYSQGYGLLAFALAVRGPADGFPSLLGVSARNRRAGVIDLLPQEVDRPGTLICLIQEPDQLGDQDDLLGHPHYGGEITFALWPDRTYRVELARVPWQPWRYSDLGSLDPYSRVDPITAGSIEDHFNSMRERYAGEPRWHARRVGAE